MIDRQIIEWDKRITFPVKNLIYIIKKKDQKVWDSGYHLVWAQVL